MASFTNPDVTRTGLLLIDIQNGFHTNPLYFGKLPRSTPSFESNVAALLAAFRRHNRPNIIHIYHSSIHPDSPLRPDHDGHRFAPYAEPISDELRIKKNVNSGFIGTDLEAILRRADLDIRYVWLPTTDHCVSITIRMACNLGVAKEVVIISDASASFAKRYWDAEAVH